MYHSFVLKINKVCELLAMAFLVIMIAVVFFQIIGRELLHTSVPWFEELAKYLLVWTTFIASGYAYQKVAHLNVEAFIKKLSFSNYRLVKRIIYIICISFAFIILIYGYQLVAKSINSTTPGMGISMSIVYSIIPIGASLQIINLIDLLIKPEEKTSEVGD